MSQSDYPARSIDQEAFKPSTRVYLLFLTPPPPLTSCSLKWSMAAEARHKFKLRYYPEWKLYQLLCLIIQLDLANYFVVYF